MIAAPGKTIRVLIAEDSPTQRQLLSFLLDEAGGFEIVGTAADGLEAIDATERLRPDIVLMDCFMPRADGFEATRVIMERCPTPIVMISSVTSSDEVGRAFDAVKYGALTFIKKPSFDLADKGGGSQDFIQTVRLMSEIKVVRRRARPGVEGLPGDAPSARPQRLVKLIAIAGSTGAPGVIGDILKACRDIRSAPILVVQHMVEGFVGGFANWLSSYTSLPVHVAEDRALPVHGAVYVAPDNRHLGIDAYGRIALNNGPLEDGFRPSASHLFRSVARHAGASSMGVLLTGMGRDGASGLQALRAAGGITAAQDEASCVVFGMPREAIALNAVDHVLAPPGIAKLILAHSLPGRYVRDSQS